MDKELNCPPLFGMEISSGQFQNCFFQSNWGNSIDQNDPFESALSSMVSSPTTAGITSNGGDLISGDGMMIRELIGRLGSICDSNNSSSTKTSCYSTPLNSPPKLDLSNLMIMGSNGNFPNYPPNLGSFNTDPGFVERAARFSSLKIVNNSVPKLECGKLSRVSSNNSIKVGKGGNVVMGVKFGGISTTENGEMVDSREGSSVSEQNPVVDLGLKAQNGANSRKRKPIPLAKVKDLPSQDAKVQKVGAENEESNAKRSKQESDNEEDKKQDAEQKTEQKTGDTSNNKGNQNSNNEETAKPEPPKDYIHVRARRGQATDSHSLAERVRREKISERMRFLQDLVPGCNKVTGKATVLDEIINYVQSLQRQVEFLSMKLATVNPRMEFNLEAHLSKDMIQTRGAGISPTMYPFDQTYSFGYQSSQRFSSPLPSGSENPFPLNPLNATGIRRNPGIPLPSMDGFVDPLTQVPTFWEDDLQSIVQNQMGITQNQTQNVPDNSPHAQMKLVL